MEVIIGMFGIILLLVIIFLIKFKIKFDVINNRTEKHYVIWYTASKYHEREYMLLFTHYK